MAAKDSKSGDETRRARLVNGEFANMAKKP
jgi:hypothetical protein